MPPTLTVYVKDSITKVPVAVAEVSVSIGDQKVGAGHTDREEGSFSKSIDPQYVGQTLTCRVSKDGYEPQEATYKIDQDEISPEIELVPEQPDEVTKNNSHNGPWLKIAIGIAAAIVVAVVVYLVIRPAEDPRIAYFKAEPPSIAKGESSTLSWETQYADKVEIAPTVGKVGQTGSKEVRPETTRHYKLKASNQRGEITSKVKVEVKELPRVVIPHPQEKYDVVLSATGNKRLKVIKIIRELTGASLRDAKNLVDNAPRTVKKSISKAEAREIKAKLETAGARVRVQPAR